jgi:hypothetical protein
MDGYRRDGVSRSEPFESDRQDSGKTPRSDPSGPVEGHTANRITQAADRSSVPDETGGPPRQRQAFERSGVFPV